MIKSQYLTNHLDTNDLTLAVEKTIKFLSTKKDDFDAIAFCGMSGALVAPSVAIALEKNLLMVRKDTSHSDMDVEGFYGKPQRYVIIDDFISTGRTCEKIINRISDFCAENVCIGIALYNNAGRYTNPYLVVNSINIERWAIDKMNDLFLESYKQAKEMLR